MTAIPGVSIAVVTGGGHGIGAALCRRLAGDGTKVVVADLDAVAARAVAAEIDGVSYAVDVSDEAALISFVDDVESNVGNALQGAQDRLSGFIGTQRKQVVMVADTSEGRNCALDLDEHPSKEVVAQREHQVQFVGGQFTIQALLYLLNESSTFVCIDVDKEPLELVQDHDHTAVLLTADRPHHL